MLVRKRSRTTNTDSMSVNQNPTVLNGLEKNANEDKISQSSANRKMVFAVSNKQGSKNLPNRQLASRLCLNFNDLCPVIRQLVYLHWLQLPDLARHSDFSRNFGSIVYKTETLSERFISIVFPIFHRKKTLRTSCKLGLIERKSFFRILGPQTCLST